VKLIVRRQIPIMVVSMLLLVIALSAEAQPCDEKEEKKRAQLQKQCELRKIKSEKYWNAFEGAQREIVALLREGNLTELSRYIGCHAGDMSLNEIHCESYLPIINKTHLEPFVEAISKNPGILDSARWIIPAYKIGREKYRILCANGLPFKAAQNFCDADGVAQPLIEINEVNGRIYISGVPVSGVWTGHSRSKQQ
jgi:hypothetical protein